mgnify:CR=1 FL=1
MSRLRANQITNKTANGAPTATNGFIVTGVCTATSFSGNGAGLVGVASTDNIDTSTNAVLSGIVTVGTLSVTGNAGIAGVLTYEDVTNVDSIGVITARDGLRVTGIATATAFHGDGSALTGISVGISTEASTVTDGNTVVLNLTKDDHKVLAAGVVTIDVTGGTEGASHVVRIENTGIATVGFATHFQFPSGGTPNLPTTSGAISLISFSVHKAGAAGTTLLAGASVNFS